MAFLGFKKAEQRDARSCQVKETVQHLAAEIKWIKDL
jgi:hypothetical protein